MQYLAKNMNNSNLLLFKCLLYNIFNILLQTELRMDMHLFYNASESAIYLKSFLIFYLFLEIVVLFSQGLDGDSIIGSPDTLLQVTQRIVRFLGLLGIFIKIYIFIY